MVSGRNFMCIQHILPALEYTSASGALTFLTRCKKLLFLDVQPNCSIHNSIIILALQMCLHCGETGGNLKVPSRASTPYVGEARSHSHEADAVSGSMAGCPGRIIFPSLSPLQGTRPGVTWRSQPRQERLADINIQHQLHNTLLLQVAERNA